jgi:hypothetical protein
VRGELLLDQLAVAKEQEFAVGMLLQSDCGAGNDDRCADIATHGVKRDSNLLRHERPGNLICCDPREARPHLEWHRSAVPGETHLRASAGPRQ